ncbi:Phosphate transporter [Purpureocillium lavendulum]|uniref:Phosphate transporter n=1 Tax=Purpureocillium lavendulum TaxID=1247861 RepID=A0AB34FIV4_9HYPO|nr:Phosphate transporter [Purpureocillium lavendulum]
MWTTQPGNGNEPLMPTRDGLDVLIEGLEESGALNSPRSTVIEPVSRLRRQLGAMRRSSQLENGALTLYHQRLQPLPQAQSQMRPRVYIDELEARVAYLEAQVQQLGQTVPDGNDTANRDHTITRTGNESATDRPHPDLVHLEVGGDAHFLGTSSGMYLARSVLESAGQNRIEFNTGESGSLTEESQQNDDASDDSELNYRRECPLPAKSTTKSLLDVFFSQFHVQYPILNQEDFHEEITSLYGQHETGQRDIDDPWTIFMLSMVLSIALHLVSRGNSQSRAMAESYRLNAMSQLGAIMKSRHHRTLQCLLLLLLSSVLNSKSAPMWYISGLCMRMCIDLGYHSEHTIQQPVTQQASVDMDMKRRLFWVTYSLDRSLATTLGRPFFISDEEVDVKLPDLSLSPSARVKSVHWLRLQCLQSEIVRLVYSPLIASTQSAEQASGHAVWRDDMTSKLAAWDEESQHLADSNGHNMEWWRYCYHNAMLMLHRPLSRSSLSSSESPMASYRAAKYMVHHSFIGVHRALAGFTWLDLHTQLTCGLTLLFLVLNDSGVRAEAQKDWLSFKSCIVEWETVLEKLGSRWGRMHRAKHVLTKIANAALDIVEGGLGRGGLQNHRQQALGDLTMNSTHQLGSPAAHRRASGRQAAVSGLFAPGTSRPVGLRKSKPARTGSCATAEPQHPRSEETSPWQVSGSVMPEQPMPYDLWHGARQQQNLSAFNEASTLSYLLADDNWQANELNASQPYRGGYDHALGFESFGLDFQGSMTGLMDAAVTDSVLNFLEPVDMDFSARTQQEPLD